MGPVAIDGLPADFGVQYGDYVGGRDSRLPNVQWDCKPSRVKAEQLE